MTHNEEMLQMQRLVTLECETVRNTQQTQDPRQSNRQAECSSKVAERIASRHQSVSANTPATVLFRCSVRWYVPEDAPLGGRRWGQSAERSWEDPGPG